MFQFEKVTEILHWKPPSVFKEEIFEDIDLAEYQEDGVMD